MFFALAGLALNGIVAGLQAQQQNEQEYQRAKLEAKRAWRQAYINRDAARDSYTTVQSRLNQEIKQALYKREAMLIKLTKARGTYAAAEGRTGKSFRRLAAVETFGAWGRDSARLSEQMTDLSASRQAEMNRVSRQRYEADVNASASVRPPAYTNPGLAILGSVAGGLSGLAAMRAPNPYGSAPAATGASAVPASAYGSTNFAIPTTPVNYQVPSLMSISPTSGPITPGPSFF
tara:strand:- start:8987 stop:9685 length:699 start_codon:yes stop_codon:yes gene_type:complete